MSIDYSFLRGKIRSYYGSEKNFVKALQKQDISISAGAFSNKINGKSDFNQSEIIEICKLLNIDMINVSQYFFTFKYELNS